MDQTKCKHCRNGFLDNRYGEDVECINGVLIDIDVATEGWQRDVNYPVAPCHPMWANQCAQEDGWPNDCQERLEQWASLGNEMETEMTDEQINYMVHRFLGWRLPENFNPDAGISFEAAYNKHMSPPSKHEPVGTNLFSAEQAKMMVRYMLVGLPPA